ncbi:acyltransferase family protein [Pseudoclavibacter sp. JSM 162008]|uniref:acyltransferase family protein n=1 Tax=Pseudoclavibacter sp. JSM 162008 TaxID=3229855 RepID=UPI003526AFE1
MRETWMDALRGIAMLLVVLFHAGTGVAYFGDFYPRGIEVFNEIVEPYRMPTLMFLSGMLLYKSLNKRATVYFSGKARKIAWPYFLWSMVGLALAGDLAASYILRIAYNPAETHLWYLWFLLIFYTAAWVLRKVPSIAIALVALAASQFLPEAFRLEKAAFLFAFFMLGSYYSQHRQHINAWVNKPLTITLAVVAAALASYASVEGLKVVYEPLYALGVVGMIAIAMNLVPRIRRGRTRSALEFLGRNSIVLYIVHLFAIRAAGTVMARVDLTNPYLQYPIFVAIGLVSGLAFILLTIRWPRTGLLFAWPTKRERIPTQE